MYQNIDDKFKFKTIKNNTTYNGTKLRIREVTRIDGNKMARKQMKKMCNKFLVDVKEKYPDAEGLVSVTIKYGNRWYSGDVSSFHEPINYFSLDDYEEMGEDPESYDAIRFQFIPFIKKTKGGKDEHNDCFINCLYKYFKATKKFINPALLKESIGLERDDPIPITKIKEIEHYINENESIPYAIFVSGDAEYNSTIKTNKKIHIILSNGHYMTEKTKTTRKNYDEKPIIMVDYVDEEYQAFDGENNFVMSYEEYRTNRDKYMSSPYLIVEKNYCMDMKKLCIEESYEKYLEMAQDMKEKSKGQFNFYKTPTIKNCALNYFYDITKAIQPDPIQNNESNWINNASTHAVTYWENYTGKIHVYDINSRYPHIMQKSIHHFPIKEGTWRNIEKIDDKPEYGIYRCTINKLDDKPYKFFVFNKKNYYTHLDVIVALKYELSVELICDGEPNFLYYSKDCLIAGSYLFGKYVKTLYELKTEKVRGAKLLLNILWGALTETNTYKQVHQLTDTIDLTNTRITKLQSDGKIRINHVKSNENQFKTNYGRIKPFILAFGRSQFFFSFRGWEHLVMRMHTDSLYLTEVPPNMLPPSDKIGCLKHEYSGIITISSLNKTIKK
jgi:hypothetical protein